MKLMKVLTFVRYLNKLRTNDTQQFLSTKRLNSAAVCWVKDRNIRMETLLNANGANATPWTAVPGPDTQRQNHLPDHTVRPEVRVIPCCIHEGSSKTPAASSSVCFSSSSSRRVISTFPSISIISGSSWKSLITSFIKPLMSNFGDQT